jgi:2-oxoglutarate dehydrogenase E2 component (dihydrolipoamide succinyltransferase)
MAYEIKVPEMGESVIEATVVNWLKKPGERIAVGDAVVELETDKITLEVNAQQAGVLQSILHPVGENVAVGDVLGILRSESGAGETPPIQAGESRLTGVEVPAVPAQAEAGPGAGVETRATPLAQRMALDMGIDLAKVTPSGSGGRITKEDVQTYAGQSQPRVADRPSPVPSAPTLPGQTQPSAPAVQAVGLLPQADRREERVRMSRRRLTIARRLVEVHQTAAMLTTFNEIDMSAVIDLRKRRREGFKERFGVDLGYMSFFVKACIAALKEFPNINAEIQGDEIVRKHYYDIGVAIGAEQGLVVPVVRDADRLNFAGIEKTIRLFVGKVKEGTLSLEDLRGGTFTITNGGVFGSLLSTPILNPPQVGILGMHAIKERVIVVDGQMVIRPMMYVALSYDHRIVDGREAVQFLVRIKELIEDPTSLLLG